MVNQELRDYVARCRQIGWSDEQIKSTLSANGWQATDVAEALSEHPSAGIPQPIALPPISYEKNFGPLILLTLGAFIPMIAIEGFSLWVRNGSGFAYTPALGISAGILFVVAIFLALWFAMSMIFYVSRNSEGLSAAMHYALRRVHSYLWIAILADLIVQFGNMLLIIPGIVFAVWFSFSAFVLAQEDTRGLNALLKSKEYVRGKWWQVFGTLIVLMFGVAVIIIACAIISRLNPTPSVVMTAIILMIVLLIAYYPFALIQFYNLFARIKNEKGVVPVPAKGRGLFGTFAVLGILAPIIFFILTISYIGNALTGHHYKSNSYSTTPAPVTPSQQQ